MQDTADAQPEMGSCI